MVTQYFKVGLHTFSLILPDERILPGLYPYRDFSIKSIDTTPSFQFTVTDKTLAPINGREVVNFVWEGAHCCINSDDKQTYEVIISPQDGDLSYKMHVNKEFTRATGELRPEGRYNFFALNNYLMMCYTFANCTKKTLMVHASVIKKDGYGYLFMGKSGTGKSTHSRLWLNNIEGCELLNDDNPVVQIDENNDLIVFGSPWSGKTPCYKNEGVPVGAFISLEQAPYNRITKLSKAQSFASLFPSCSCFRQDEHIYDNICNTVIEAVSGSNSYKLECLPDREAAIVCHNMVKIR